jgi:hypothetical protein
MIQVEPRQHESQRLPREIVTATTIAEDMTPAARLLNASSVASMHDCACSSDDDNPILVFEGSRDG